MSASQIYLGSSHLIERNIDLTSFFSLFGYSEVGIQKYKDLSYVFKIILTLSDVVKIILTLNHGQASVERGFSISKLLVKVNMKEEAIVAKKIIRDYMLANLLKPYTGEISNKLILSCLLPAKNTVNTLKKPKS